MSSILVATAMTFIGVAQAWAQVSWPEVVERASHAVVVVETEKALGSGFFVRPDGTLVTNLHVIDGATRVAVRTASGEMFRGAFVMASDRTRDLAILRVDAFDMPVVQLGNSNDAKVGSAVLLLGAPRGLEQSASTGIVAGFRSNDSGTRLVQTSAAASPGSSGGPLLGESGQVLGVLTFSLTESQNLNFAIPINYVRGMLERLSTVTSQPESKLEALVVNNAAARAPDKAPSKAAPNLGGLYVTGFGPTDYLQQVYLELTQVLAEGDVKVVELSDVRTSGSVTSIAGLVAAAKDAGAAGLLYFTLSTDYRLRLQCYAADGRMLWQDETASSWGSVDALTKRMKDKLRRRVNEHELPGQKPQRWDR